MFQQIARVAIVLALQVLVLVGQGAVICVGDDGHQQVEVASADCCDRPDAAGNGAGWSAGSACGPCVDLPYALVSVCSDAPRSLPDLVTTPLDLGSVALPAISRDALALHVAPGERLLTGRAPSPLRV